jgi:hypothetical protein
MTVCAALVGAAPANAIAQNAPPPPEQPKVIDLGSVTDPPPDLLDGTLSGLGDELDDEQVEQYGSSWLRFPSPLQPWLDFKQTVLLQQYGLMIGGSEGILGQDFSNSLTNEHNTVGQKFTLNVGQQLLWKGTPEAFWIDMVVEDRGPVGTEFAPLQAGLRTGSSTATAPTWGEFGLGVTQLYLRQNLFDNHFQYTFGKIFAPNYVNPYPFFDDNRQYLNQIFTTSVTIPVPLRGFGAVAAWFPTDFGFYAKGGIYTVYSDDTGFTADSFFNKPQYFRHLELGWSGTAANGTPIQARGPMDANNFSVTLWNKDAEQNGPAAAQGGRVQRELSYSAQPDGVRAGRLVRRVATRPQPQFWHRLAAQPGIFRLVRNWRRLGAALEPEPARPVYLRSILPLSTHDTACDHARRPMDPSPDVESKHRLDLGGQPTGAAYFLRKRAMERRLSRGLRSCLDGAPWSRVALKIL